MEIRRRLGYLPQELGYHRHFTVAAFLDYVAILKEIVDRRRRAEEVARVLAAVGLEGVARTRIRTLSGGMRQRLGIAQALLGQPDLLILDEPTAGLDPEQQLRFRELLSDLPGDPVIVLSTHQVDDIAAICPTVVVLLQGRVRFAGTPAELAATAAGHVWAADERDARAYLSWRGGDNRWHHLGDAPARWRRAGHADSRGRLPAAVPYGRLRDDRRRGRTRASVALPPPRPVRGDAGTHPRAVHGSPGCGRCWAWPGWRRRCWSAACWCWPGCWRAAPWSGRSSRRRNRCGGTPPGRSATGSSSSPWPSWSPRSWPPGGPGETAMADLYDSFPATASTRTVAHLAGLAGAAPASLVLIGAAAAVAQARGAIGAPSITVLAGGLLLVIAAGAAGIAIGRRFPHPLAGALGALVLFLSSGTSHRVSGGGIWLFPWEWTQDQLGWLPGPLAGYPPAVAHALELAGIAVLAGVVALTVTACGARARAGAGDGGHPGPGGDLPRRGTAAAARPHRRPEPPGRRGRRPGLGAALHHRQPASATAFTPASAASCRHSKRRSTGCSRSCPPGLASR